jgi:DNA-binding transcriptional ArsR family regulator
VTSARERAATAMMEVLNSEFLRALTEPARLELLRILLLHGPADVATIASHLPQDRSVISRHLKLLEQAGIVESQQDGRHRIYGIDGASFIETLEAILGKTKSLASACCPPLAAAIKPKNGTKR